MRRSGPINYEFPEATSKEELRREAMKAGYKRHFSRVCLGKGLATFKRAREALIAWRQFQVGWAHVDPGTKVEAGENVVVCARVLGVWSYSPLKILWVKDKRNSELSFAHGCRHGHVFRGEERFSVRYEADGRVYYEVESLSKPGSWLYRPALPALRHLQRRFAACSARAMSAAVASNQGGV